MQAEEGDEEINEVFRIGNKKKKVESSSSKIAFDVEKVMAELELAAKEDAHLNWLGKPAINKLKKLSHLTNVLSKLVDCSTFLFFFIFLSNYGGCLLCRKQLQHEFLDRGVLTLLKGWLEPLPDGSLPNITVRTEVLNVLNDVWIGHVII